MPSLKSRISQPCVSSAYRALYPSAVGLFRPSGPIIPLSATKTKLSKVHESTGPANRLRTREGTVPASTGFHEYQAQNPAGHPVSRFGDSQRVTTVYNKNRSLGEPMVCGIRSGLYYLRYPNLSAISRNLVEETIAGRFVTAAPDRLLAAVGNLFYRHIG